MLSFQLKQESEQLLEAFKSADVFFSMLHAINSSFPQLDTYLEKIAEGGDKNNTTSNQLRSHLSSLRHVIKNINIREFYQSLEAFQADLNRAKDYGIDDFGIIEGIVKSIDVFSGKYEKYIGSYSAQVAAPLITEARKLSSMLDGFKTALVFFVNNLDSQEYGLDESGEISILLTSQLSLEQFANKLMALNNIYNELCSLLSISTSEHPLLISKIESGSLWVKLFGESRVIGMMVSFLSSTATFIYRNYTREGNLTEIPKKIETINKILNLTKQLQESGLNVDEAKEHIAKSAIALSKELNCLIEGQVEVTINNDKHSVGGEVQKKLLELNKPLQISHVEYNNSDDN